MGNLAHGFKPAAGSLPLTSSGDVIPKSRESDEVILIFRSMG